jgi:23S rRNA pseudouridine2457 synthase
MAVFNYYRIFKPYGMLSQFTAEAGHPSLADLDFKFPKDVYPVGRLDHDTEGLLLLTNDPAVNKNLLDPTSRKRKIYWVQIEGEMNGESMEQLEKGVTINFKGKLHHTAPAKVKRIKTPQIAERNPSVNYVKHPTTSWIEITITEGKNRQVRKMTAKVRNPALRLIRFGIEGISIDGMSSGDIEEIAAKEFYSLLKLNER